MQMNQFSHMRPYLFRLIPGSRRCADAVVECTKEVTINGPPPIHRKFNDNDIGGGFAHTLPDGFPNIVVLFPPRRLSRPLVYTEHVVRCRRDVNG